MKITIINGSPKARGSASELIIKAFQSKLGPNAECTVCHAALWAGPKVVETATMSDAIVLVFPLYVDSIPSHLLRLLDTQGGALSAAAPGAKVYAVVNNGFYEGRQNAVALEILRNFCARYGLTWGQGLGVGAGGVITAVPMDSWPLRPLDKALDDFADAVAKGAIGEDVFITSNLPRFVYQLSAHSEWRKLAKKHGLTTKQLYQRPAK
ncbi:MAG: hypothetical protein LBN10_09850 [Propionibacteriaceae bacterium]|jgi:NAD(P)H-dependent FMN reductase|nr:hypothetical protein [Propionibacteriaceae bacterium]